MHLQRSCGADILPYRLTWWITTRVSTARARASCLTAHERPTISGVTLAGRSISARPSSCERQEWASTADDILERRTKHGLRLAKDQKQAFADWMLDTAKSA